jgi:hypothetical protein
MWICLKDEFQLWGHSIGVRRSFQVVIIPPQGPMGFLDFLKGLQ